jgi:CRP-like cAMP-binding protein
MADANPTRKDFLVRTPFFGGLEDASLDRIVRMLGERELPEGAKVFQEGENGRSMYVVESGVLIACRAGSSGKPVRLRHFWTGDFFGEMTLIEMQPRPYTVVVEQPARLYELTSADLYRLYREDVKAYVLVLQNINRELCRRIRSSDTRVAELADEAGDETTQIGSMRRR